MHVFPFALALAFAGCTAAAAQPSAPAAMDEDPYLWLEKIEGDRALAKVRAWNEETAAELTADPDFEAYRTRAEAVLSDPDRIALPYDIMGARITNFWTDETNTHGLWRIADLEGYLAGQPDWRTLIDLDAMSAADGKNWVWGNVDCLPPTYARCLVQLSDGGGDARVLREFDIPSGTFVEDGFTLPVAKHDATWLDADTVLVASDFGPGTLTESGYGREVRMWRRGTAVADAPVIKTVPASDVGYGLFVTEDGGRVFSMIRANETFWASEYAHVKADGTLVPVPIPATATINALFAGKGIVQLNADWDDYASGTLLAYDLAALVDRDEFSLEPVFKPSASQAVQQVAAGKDRLYVTLLDDVNGRMLALDANWEATSVPVPDASVVTMEAAGGDDGVALFTVENFAQPPRLMAVTGDGDPSEIASLAERFEPDSIDIAQRFATSADGTKIPYFIVRPAGAEGPLPTLMHVYGGFRGGELPTYLATHPRRLGPMAQFWVEEGNSFVVANIRGGDEYGPDWHSQTLKENRQLVNDDLYAVAEDLKASGLTSTLAASGRSNGGLVVGIAYTQRPDLFDGIVMGVPLSDMKRYDKLLAGASWTGEYGDPDIPEEWAYLGATSPYQNLRADADYPPVMIYTSTKDDRVHPGHARKMAARMGEQGHKVYYYENIDGGHAGAADAKGEAYRAALVMAYAKRALIPDE